MRKLCMIMAAFLVLGLAVAAPAAQRLRLATTTSTEATGLLDVLLPPFEQANDIKVDVLSVGTGKALALAGAATWTWSWSMLRAWKSSSWIRATALSARP